MAVASGQRGTGWRGLGLFWAIVLLLLGGGAVTLQVLGPPARHVGTSEPPPGAPPPSAPSVPLAPPDQVAAPQAALLETSKPFPSGMLPRVAADGRAARTVYARAYDRADTRPRIALVITGAGMSGADTRTAIQALPGPITLAFSPYAPNIAALLDLCRKAGHEILVSIPMESQGYPLNDAGSRSLLSGATPAQNALDLDWALSRIQGYVGAIGALDAMRGERFAEQSSNLQLVLDEVAARGLLYIDPRPGRSVSKLAAVPGRDVDLVVDEPPERDEIDAKLAALERLARDKGSALGLAGPLRPLTVERIVVWARGLGDRGFALAPVSAVVEGTGH